MRGTYVRVLLAVAVAITVMATVVGCGRGTVANVNGTKITRKEFINRLERLQHTDPRTGQQAEGGLVVLQRLIAEELVLKLAEKEGVSPTEQQINERLEYVMKQPGFAQNMREAGITRDQMREHLRVIQADFNLQTRGVEVADEEVREFYDSQVEAFKTPAQVELAAIFLPDKAAADEAMDLLNNNVDFATVARTMSAEPNSAQNDGRIGALSREQLGDNVADIVFNARRNEHTQPIRLVDQTGTDRYTIFRVLGHRDEKTERFEDVEYAIRIRLMEEKGREKHDMVEEMEEFRKTAKINVKIGRYQRFFDPDAEDADQADEDVFEDPFVGAE